MRFVSFQSDNAIRPGVLVDENYVLDFRQAAELSSEKTPVYRSVLAVIEAGDRGLEAIDALLSNPHAESILELENLRLLAPLPLPQQIRDFANYENHCKRAMDASMRLRSQKEDDPQAALDRMRKSGAYSLPDIWFEIPLYYKGNRFATNGHDGDVEWPPFAQNLDYELELAAVIGSQGKDISAADARGHIFGYTIFNDFSARDIQARWEGQFRMGPAKGKDFDTSNSFGPWIVTKDEIAEPYDLAMSVRVNGEERGRGNSAGAQHSFERCIEQVSRSETIYPGEIFGLGTIENGCGFESLSFLEENDVVELEIEGIGVLRNRVVRAAAT
ncbi:MAG: 2-keto-4-pentenoate hydratase/2-oxohepta-3-ene-1,7-dioic acid hydratase in catechol pathway [Woeseiaceae bacterium]|jgi:2-keto-4-pentenoate hydratase/2-oxohepta-3-ene-1,7-dioic acid hydratase in catechol pathway